MSEYCSWCLKTVKPRHEYTRLNGVQVHRCNNQGCGKLIRRCLACKNWARWDEIECASQEGSKKLNYYYHYCEEHRHDAANFATQNSKLSEACSFLEIYDRRYANLSALTGVGIGATTGAMIFAPLGVIAAPAIAGALGVYGSGLIGAHITNCYSGAVKDFNIIRIRNGKSPAIVTVNGFLSQRHEKVDDWRKSVDHFYPGHAWYHVTWEAKHLADLGAMVGRAMFLQTLTRAATTAATRMGTIHGGLVLTAIQASRNPWHVAMTKAEHTGVLLADILARHDSQQFILVGHSLGSRVIRSALQTMAVSNTHNVVSAHLLGGADGCDTDTWTHCAEAVRCTIYNYHSANDMVLKNLYSVGTFFRSKPIGRQPIEGVENIKNMDVTSHVRGHMEYKVNFYQFGIKV